MLSPSYQLARRSYRPSIRFIERVADPRSIRVMQAKGNASSASLNVQDRGFGPDPVEAELFAWVAAACEGVIERYTQAKVRRRHADDWHAPIRETGRTVSGQQPQEAQHRSRPQ
jgi:hypothetical protein